MNYNIEMEKIMTEENRGKTLLLHACCAPCSTACLEIVANFFKVSIFYYNPNITSKEEYDLRLEEIKKLINDIDSVYRIDIIEGKYEVSRFIDISKGLEHEPERGKRCFKCYNLRLEETAKYASELGYDFFGTTLTLSPYKRCDWINEIGEELNKKYKSEYLYSDFKKKGGYQRSIELSKKYNLYRQDYCGCIYSKLEQDKRKKEE